MEAWEYWKLLDNLNIVQAALMAANLNPSEWEHEIERTRPEDLPNAYLPLRTLILNAVNRGLFLTDIVDSYDEDGQNLGTCVTRTTISRKELIEFFAEKKVRSVYFEMDIDPLDPQNRKSEFYSEKLDAAIKAWKAVTIEKHRLNKCTPKQAIETWLKENAREYGLIKNDGALNEKGIDEISKVANWQLRGGAPSIVAKYPLPQPVAPEIRRAKISFLDDPDSDVPF